MKSVISMSVKIGDVSGCLQIFDDGNEYLQIINEKISSIKREKEDFLKDMECGTHEQHQWNTTKTVINSIYGPTSLKVLKFPMALSDFEKAIEKLLKDKEIKHYKCKCKKCGAIRYYSEETIRTEPKFCYRPMYCSTKFTYSTRANNSNFNKREKYKNNESVCLVENKDDVTPAEQYCSFWNEKKKKELLKQAEKVAQIIAVLPRRFAKNYDADYVGKTYESLDVLECVDDKLESIPSISYNQRHQKRYSDIIVYKKYRCRCYLCGQEQMVTCDKFGIYPPTVYGYRAYDGYWSTVYCDCHKISSFQWIVNDILIKHDIDYRVEVSVDVLYGIDNVTPLRFDFAVYEGGKLTAFIECQGEQHYKPVKEFGGARRFVIQQRNDAIKRTYAKEHNIKLIEISYKHKRYGKVEALLKEQHII